ncbi:MAG: hypothetical protein HWE26_06935 [Alteromonadaceae bacterium]|nr:hypothetical protein [Alteromonadaceae bacterium]
MRFKINFFARPIDADYRVHWESLLIECALGIVCAVMALYGWQTGMLLMAVPAAVVAFMCIGLVIYSLVSCIFGSSKT